MEAMKLEKDIEDDFGDGKFARVTGLSLSPSYLPGVKINKYFISRAEGEGLTP